MIPTALIYFNIFICFFSPVISNSINGINNIPKKPVIHSIVSRSIGRGAGVANNLNGKINKNKAMFIIEI